MIDDSARIGRAAASVLLAGLLLCLFWPGHGSFVTGAQPADDTSTAEDDPAGPSGDPPATTSADEPTGEEPAAGDADASPSSPLAGPEEGRLSLVWLILKGGYLMIPIGLMSLMVAMFGIERALGLRRSRVIPEELVKGIGQLTRTSTRFDPRPVWRLCDRFPSSAATVLKATTLTLGRRPAEVEHAAAEASDREASKLYANVRWLTLAAGVSPLLGLLGTVWGMIQAFFQTTQLEAGQNKADFLAQGIYVALVTTLGGLAVAIPAAILAHYFEGRIQSLFHDIHGLVRELSTAMEPWQGKVRVTAQSFGGDGVAEQPAPATAEEESPVAAAPQ
jgi:biopolymer transport protein ExbB